jgi:uncharacterized protein (DUF736 family)
MENKQKLEEAGAFWIKKSKAGTNFLTGSVKTKSGEEVKVIVFKNKYKTEGSNQPDYRVYFDSNPLNKGETSSETSSESMVKDNPSKEQKKSELKIENKSEEIPF